MTDKELKLVIGALLHDIGKVIFRTGDGRKHSISGYEFLKDEAHITDADVLDSVRFHHQDALKSASIDENAIAYIVYIADNIAAATDRRKSDQEEKGFNPEVPLQSIFNILNGNQKQYHYYPKSLDDKEGINMPTTEEKNFDRHFYQRIKTDMLDALKGVESWHQDYVNSLLSVMEAYLSYIPSSTVLAELTDISLYDHVKMTAAYSSCIYQYLESLQISDYKKVLFKDSRAFYEKKAFRLFSMDISGIQKFIYTIHSEGALRMLRSRSFYLEILMEHMIDEILEACSLTRANLIYSGGGHCYILLANTEQTEKKLRLLQDKFNKYFLETFDISLYVAMASVECSPNDLENQPSGTYALIFKTLSQSLAKQKSRRYSIEQIQFLNRRRGSDGKRECKVCKKTSETNENGRCTFCELMSEFSNDILYKDFFTVIQEKRINSIPLPDGRYLIAQTEEELRKTMETDDYFVRTYGKNKLYTGKSVTTKLWVADYTKKGKTTENYAKEAEGIDRIAVLRADVDNLGQAFVSGFPEKYTTLSRTATLSRQLSLFFKHYINDILKNSVYKLSKDCSERNATVVYSGGDDLFIVGSWDDVIALAVDIQQTLEEYSIGALTISAGIGIYPAKYPLNISASEVADMEEQSKGYPDKNAITLLSDTYSWKDFTEKVIGEKLNELEKFFANSGERGKAFLYRLLELIRNMNERINLARFAYVLTRLEPVGENMQKEKLLYREFSKKMYQWVQDKEDQRQLVTAIYIYVYLHREKEEQ